MRKPDFTNLLQVLAGAILGIGLALVIDAQY